MRCLIHIFTLLLLLLPSCSYDAEFCARREREQTQRKFKQGLSRSRDNFELGKIASEVF